MECVISQGFPLSYTFESVLNNVRSTIDHFIISHSLIESVTKYCVLNDVDNMSDHLPL